MTDEQLKNLLRDLRATQARLKFLENYSGIGRTGKEKGQDEEQGLRVGILTDAMDILDAEEKFIIDTHLVCHHTWAETTELFSGQFGYARERSERTLKRIQHKSIRKMLDLINSSPAGDYLAGIK